MIEVDLRTIVIFFLLNGNFLFKPFKKNMLTNNNIQLQIECNSLKNSQTCLICKNQFEMNEARLIVCNDRGDRYGDICPNCITRGGKWIGSQLELTL
jgi:hypothetical protein